MILGILVGSCALLGLAVGSFLNVVIYRVPRKESIVAPRSACPDCGTPISNRDNVPLVSWLLLKGRCRSCGLRISARYPLVEAVTAALFVGVAIRFGAHAALPAYLVMVAGLLALACIDVETRLLPKRVVYLVFGLLVALLFVATIATGHWRSLALAATFSAAWYVLFFAINRIDGRLLGFGDVRLALVLGFGLGWLGVPAVLIGFFGANLIGAAFGIALLLAKRSNRSTPLPFGAFLALGAVVAIFVGPSLHLHLRSI
ncbi:MAG TPA: prepilin peptidase [Acidimicrobiales bacterium]|nr:prepilin peptidase [Acidimicrobiales bacterium]